jgi:hypothetical protein
MPFLIDSNVVIDVSRGNAAAIKYVDGLISGSISIRSSQRLP